MFRSKNDLKRLSNFRKVSKSTTNVDRDTREHIYKFSRLKFSLNEKLVDTHTKADFTSRLNI